MTTISIPSNYYSDSTIVPNPFIDSFMVHANEAQIKIYLYLLRCAGNSQSVSVSQIADQFNHTEKDVIRSLKYWEREGLLALSKDEEKNISSIVLLPYNSLEKNTIQEKREEGKSSPSTKGQIVSLPVPVPVKKPSYSKEQLISFQEDGDLQQLLFITEQYLQKPLSSWEINTLFYFYDSLHLSADLIEYLIEYCVNNNHKNMRYIEKVAIAWAEEGIATVEQAKASTSHFKKEYYDILKAYGLNLNGRNPVDSEISYIKRWTTEYGFDFELIIEACNRTMNQIHQANFEYTDTILKNWKAAKVHHPSDLEALDIKHQKAKSDSLPLKHSQTVSNNRFNNFEQRAYDLDELESQLLSN